jgi:hypothetical protein
VAENAYSVSATGSTGWSGPSAHRNTWTHDPNACMKAGVRKTLLWVFALWAAVVLALLSPRFVAVHRETRKVERKFTEYVGALVSQHFDEAYAECGTAFRSAMTYDRFVSMYKSLQGEYGALRSAKRTAYDVRGSGTPMYWRAVIDADLVYEKKTLRFEFVFHKEGDRWVLFGAEQL